MLAALVRVALAAEAVARPSGGRVPLLTVRAALHLVDTTLSGLADGAGEQHVHGPADVLAVLGFGRLQLGDDLADGLEVDAGGDGDRGILNAGVDAPFIVPPLPRRCS